MSLELCVLASGSSGNCSLLRGPGGVMLIDAGLGPRATARRLDGTGVALRDIAAICITHLDHDHFNRRWLTHIVERRIRIYCHESAGRVLLRQIAREVPEGEAAAAAVAGQICCFNGSMFAPMHGVRFEPIPLPHDRLGSHGFVIDGFGSRIGYATDLGRVPARLIECFDGLDLLALESNYDPAMQRSSRRPWFLQERIMGGAGHLSNEQALAAVRLILNRAEKTARRLPAHIVLLHRSRQCNCPNLVKDLFCRDARIAARLTLTHQHQRTPWLRPGPIAPAAGEQLLLAWA